MFGENFETNDGLNVFMLCEKEGKVEKFVSVNQFTCLECTINLPLLQETLVKLLGL